MSDIFCLEVKTFFIFCASDRTRMRIAHRRKWAAATTPSRWWGLFLHYNYCFSDGVVMILREFFVTSALLVSNFYLSPSPFNHLNANSKKKSRRDTSPTDLPMCFWYGTVSKLLCCLGGPLLHLAVLNRLTHITYLLITFCVIEDSGHWCWAFNTIGRTTKTTVQ
jgi:hypothetical protein